MNLKLMLAAAVSCAALAPGIASAALVLDTGTPSGATIPAVNASAWYAAEFSLSAGETVNQLAAYLGPGVSGGQGSSFTLDIYSATGFLGANRAPALFADTVGYSGTGTGWQTANVNWTPSSAGNYWIALQISGTSQSRGFTMPSESSATTGSAPAIAFAFAGNNHQYSTQFGVPVGFQVNATSVPLPAAVWLLGGGLLGLGSRLRRKALSA